MNGKRTQTDVEKARDRHSPHRRRLSRQYHITPRFYRIILTVILLLYPGHSLIHYLHKLYDKRLRDQPTDFNPLIEATNPIWWREFPVLHDNGTHIGDRYVFMRHLGQGKEGRAAIYVDMETGESVVVKTYFGHGYNGLPPELLDVFDEYTSRWPNEIEASLLIGDQKACGRQSFVPVRDFFVLHSSTRRWNWAMITPFIAGGTLLDLADRMRGSVQQTPQELDRTFRAVLHGTLEALVQLHSMGYCHNDIKADNVFVRDTYDWLLGDLGQVRQFGHPWHGTMTWRERNQLSDCYFNDVRRLLKSYMTFLRQSSMDPELFDRAFFAEKEAWSALYWSWMRMPMSAGETIMLSHEMGIEERAGRERVEGDMGVCLRQVVERELKCTSIQKHWRDYLMNNHC